MTPLILYRQQAAKERDAANEAVLENVRERSRRAAEAWTNLASQIEHTDELRATRRAVADAVGHSTGPSENPDRGRATSSLNAVGATQPISEFKGNDGNG